MPALLTIQQVATELGCSKQFVYALVKRKVSINKIVLGILIISWVCAAFGILAA